MHITHRRHKAHGHWTPVIPRPQLTFNLPLTSACVQVVPVTSQSDISTLLERARQQRAVAATNCNEHSSRSHSVFTLRLDGHNGITTETCHGESLSHGDVPR